MSSIHFTKDAPLLQGSVLVLFYAKTLLGCHELSDSLQSHLHRVLKAECFQGRAGDVLVLAYPLDTIYKKIVIVGVDDNFQVAGATLYKEVCSEEVIAVEGRNLTALELARFVFGFFLPAWSVKKYRRDSKENALQLLLVCQEPDACVSAYQRFEHLLAGVHLARELTTEPGNVLYPSAYCERLLQLRSYGIEVTILTDKDLSEAHLNLLLAVGQGSANPPYLAILEWKGVEEPPVAIIGKGVCFDSGGLCLKEPVHLPEMKWDKAGAGAVVGLLRALAGQKAPVHVVGIIGLVENMPDGKAIRPGDVVKSGLGLTVEIVDTDNEGRLVLADALWYAQKHYQPSTMIDLGTLTLEVFGALAGEYAGLFSNDSSLTQELLAAGEMSAEKLWPMPMGKGFAKQLHSTIADCTNAGQAGFGECGAAAEFLRQFVSEIPWGHLDIAGVAWTKDDQPFAKKGVTGFGVLLLEQWFQERLARNSSKNASMERERR